MKRALSRRFTLLSSVTLALLLAAAGLSTPTSVHAQSNQLSVRPSTLFRFRVSNSKRGYMLTGIAQRGFALNYFNEGSLFPNDQLAGISISAGIVLPPAANYTPAAGQQLVPLYQWRVVQGSRTYYYYATSYQSLGGGYYFEGLVGYVLPSNFTTTVINGQTVQAAPVNYYYSPSYGYWYSTTRPELIGGCFPDTCSPGSSYSFQGVGFSIPVTQMNGGFCGIGSNCPVFLFDPPYVPPPPTCEPSDEQYCDLSGGSWDSGTCSCNYNWQNPT
jgi:hypothetical protein